MRAMTLREAYDRGKEGLRKSNVEEYELDAWYLLSYVTGISRAQYYLRQEEALSSEQEKSYALCIEKRSHRIPLQHITGEQEFMGLTFEVNRDVLIPRQDTETLVEEALKVLEPGMRALDMCTGSGCIIISLLKYREGISGTGADISEKALETARRNCERNGAFARLVQGDLFENINGAYDLIISNPPYIKTSVIEELSEEVKYHDPLTALDGKEDGLYFYRRIVDEGRAFLKEGGRLYFEIGYDQGEDVKRLMENAGFCSVCIKKDMAGLDRVVMGVYNKSDGRI